MKRYSVELETYENDVIEVEAENEQEAKEIAQDIFGFDWEVVFIDEVTDE